MKRFGIFGLLGISVLSTSTLFGCGGGGGSSATGSTGGATGGGTTASLSGQIMIAGGTVTVGIAQGSTQTVQLTDTSGNRFTLPSAFAPDNIAVGASAVVIKAGSNLLAGHYTSQSATYVNTFSSVSVPLPLTSAGTLAEDVVVPAATSGAIITLPISSIGSFSFPNGIQIRIGASFNADQVQTMSFTGTAALPPSGSPAGQYGSTTATFGGPGVPSGGVGFSFQGTGFSDCANDFGSSPFTIQGEAQGQSTTFPTASVIYTYSD